MSRDPRHEYPPPPPAPHALGRPADPPRNPGVPTKAGAPRPGEPVKARRPPFEIVGAAIVWTFACCALACLLAAALVGTALVGTALVLRALWRVVS